MKSAISSILTLTEWKLYTRIILYIFRKNYYYIILFTYKYALGMYKWIGAIGANAVTVWFFVFLSRTKIS